MGALIGQLLNGRYEILERLGGGGMAVVFKGRDNFLGRPVSIKVLREQFATDGEFLQRFRREAQAVASLSHPNIVSLFDVGQDGNTHYLVMEYVEGETLKDKISQEGPLPVVVAVDIASQILAALEQAHRKRVVHRDIKPHNILITPGGQVKVTDFGIARAMDGSTLVHTGSIVGSAYYFSPEQARGQPADARSDLYSVGVVLYEMLAGSVPFDGDNPLSVAIKHVQEEPPSLRRANPSVPFALEQVVRRALAKEPERRFQTAEEFRSALEAWRHRRLGSGGVGAGFSWRDDTLVAGRGEEWQWPVNGKQESEDADAVSEEAGGGRRRGRLLPVLAVVLGVLALAGYALFGFMRWLQVPVVTVPDLVNRSLPDAQRLLDERGLQWEVVGTQHSDVPANYVLRQDPPAGETVKRGRTISLWISGGPEWATVPDVVGRHRQEAEAILDNLGLGVEEGHRYDEKVPEEYVIDQQPPKGSRVQRGTKVFLTISRGPAPAPFRLPNLVGSTVDEARRTLEQVRLRVNRIDSRLSGFPAGVVAGQDPPAGTLVREGDMVDLTVSSGCAATTQRTILVESDHPVTVRVVVIDQAGPRTVYEALHGPGDEVAVNDICWDGGIARLQVFFDQELKAQEVLTAEG